MGIACPVFRIGFHAMVYIGIVLNPITCKDMGRRLYSQSDLVQRLAGYGRSQPSPSETV